MKSAVNFWNLRDDTYQDNIWPQLKNGLWKEYDIKVGIENDCLPMRDINQQHPVFPHIQQIIPGTKWSKTNRCLDKDLFFPSHLDSSFMSLMAWSDEYFNTLGANRIGVHLSGGLDSSIIICLLHALKIPFVPIGLRSNTFEFRTERHIQDLLLSYGEDGEIIDLEEYPFYSNLEHIPPHQIPMPAIKSNASTEALVKAFKKKKCDIVFTGQGGDTLFVDKITKLSDVSYNIGAEFDSPYDRELYYNPEGISLVSFYSLPYIINALTTAAIGRTFDPYKLWARTWFKSILPKELSDYHYCADFFGLSLGCLEHAKPTIRLLFEEAYDLTFNSIFSPKYTNDFLSQDIFSFEHSEYTCFCSIISTAVWYHSLFNNA